MIIKKMGAIFENDKGDLCMSGFVIDAQGESMASAGLCALTAWKDRIQREIDRIESEQPND